MKRTKDPIFPDLTCSHDKNESSINYPRFYIAIYTKPLNNHPFLIYGNLNQKTYHIVVPIGNKAGHLEIDSINNIAHHLKKEENYACRVLLNKTIIIRQKSILQNREYSLFKCGNIKECQKQIKLINRKRLSEKEKEKQIKRLEASFHNQASTMIKHYFKLLEMGKFQEAMEFLKGGKYTYYHNNLQNYFIKDRNLLGHLQIFISLYKMVKHLISLSPQ